MRDRWRFILKELDEKGQIKVSDMGKAWGCSEVTVRNDIIQMDKEGLLTRIHGGAVKRLGEKGTADFPYTAESLFKNVERKKRIAARAYDFIEDRDTIIIDDASTSFYLASYIKEHPEKRIAVVTNSLLAGNELSSVRHVELYMVGGYVGGYLAATMGEEAVEHMKDFHVDKAFIGAHGINFKAGLTSIATPQMQMKQAILKASKKTFVLADSSKFGGGYLTIICPIDAVDRIITDREISQDDREMAEKMKIPLEIA